MVDQNTTNLFNNIYDSTNKKVLAYITAKCGNTSDISDIFQETYMELYAVLVKKGTNYVKNSEAFVIKIAKQKIFRYYSLSQRLKSMVPMININEEGEEFNIADLEIDSFSVDKIVSEKMLIAQVNQFLSTKPVDIRKIFYLFYYMNMPISEIALLLSMSESNVKNKLYRTIKELRKIY